MCQALHQHKQLSGLVPCLILCVVNLINAISLIMMAMLPSSLKLKGLHNMSPVLACLAIAAPERSDDENEDEDDDDEEQSHQIKQQECVGNNKCCNCHQCVAEQVDKNNNKEHTQAREKQ